ncbi:putative phosphosugar-binding protein [Psychromicrobium silvestre]|uniref:Putative phosphosugar-binding protein n=1 Tax=Psychromicrobium silvestre TaxID=1645614 RepID=A0A7Y9LUS7_9MICC|nr:SIS domain-containing protein [Psychromicrobium silvestre]NYE95995.1 putative phosphosugar-binding protein [Psychromicrobium silvestre]
MSEAQQLTARKLFADFHQEVVGRLDQLANHAADGGLDAAIELLSDSVSKGGVIQVFGTGHSEAFAMEVAGRAGGLIPTNKIALRTLVLRGGHDVEVLSGSSLERNPAVITELLEMTEIHPQDVFIIASNSGVNGSIVELALQIKDRGHSLIAVTSLQHTNAVSTKHPSGKRLSEVADVVIDNLAPFGDSTLETADGTGLGAVSSLTAAYIAQLFTIGTVARLAESGERPPVYISANAPGGDEHNSALEALYGQRIRRD